MELKTRKSNDIYIVDVKGDMDLYNSYKLKDLIKKMVQSNVQKIIINLGEVNYIDSSGIGALIHIYSTIKKMNYDIVFVNIRGSVKKVIELTKLMSYFPIAGSIEDALKAVKQ